MKIIKETLFIIILGTILGLGVNFSLLRKYLSGEFRQAFLSRDKYPGITFITLAETEELFSKGEALFIDSRSRQEYISGHILGALNIPFEESREKFKTTELGFLKGKTLVVYCSGGDCETSLSLAKLLYDQGLKDIKIFSGGWAEWSEAGLPAATEK